MTTAILLLTKIVDILINRLLPLSNVNINKYFYAISKVDILIREANVFYARFITQPL